MPLDLSALSPAVGELNADPETARFTKIHAVLEIDVGFVPVVYAKLGDEPYAWHLVFDGVADAFSPMFDEHSDVEVVGQVYTFEILPTGGWWASPVALTFGQFEEAL